MAGEHPRTEAAWADRDLHVIVKPIGPVCNLNCAYCFYLPKQSLYPADESWRMSDETLETFIRQYVAAQREGFQRISFMFQGGEPTLMGLDFFRRVVELQRKYVPRGRRIHNSLQTNGILLDDAWCQFLREKEFFVGLSIDGPADLHNVHRRDKQGAPTFDRVRRAIDCLQKHKVDFSTLTCLTRTNADSPARIYRFLRDSGVEFMQFIPVIERLPHVELQGGDCPDFRPTGHRPEVGRGLSPSVPPEALVSPRSVLPEQYGRFLCEIFGLWVRRDVGEVFVRDFEVALQVGLGMPASLCVHGRQCGRALAMEHNGDLYSCDHFVNGAHRLGNIHQTPLVELANSPAQQEFGREKERTLPDSCRRCRYLHICHGGCPKERFVRTPDGRPGGNYLCRGYQMFYQWIEPTIRAMVAEIRAGRPASTVMQQLRGQWHR